eukprot:3939163-Rhodomonas_salina.1
MYLLSVMHSLGFEQDSLTPVTEDNVACIYMLKSLAMFNKGKHIDVRVYRLREFVQDGVMELYHVSTTEQVADMFTKALQSETLKKHSITKLKSRIVGSGAADNNSAGGAYEDAVSQD